MTSGTSKKSRLTKDLQNKVQAFTQIKCSAKTSTRLYTNAISAWLASGLTIDEYLSSVALSPSTKHQTCAILNSFCEFAEIDDRGAVDFHKGQRYGLKDSFTVEQVKTMLSACRDNIRLHVAIRLGAQCGFRLSDCVNLRWSMISNGICTITRKGMKPFRFRMSPAIITELEQIREYDNDFCLPNTHIPGTGISSELLGREFRKLQKQCGLYAAQWTFHSLRHCFAISAVEKGLSVDTIRQMLGHSDIQTTYIYLQRLNRQSVVDDGMNTIAGIYEQ